MRRSVHYLVLLGGLVLTAAEGCGSSESGPIGVAGSPSAGSPSAGNSSAGRPSAGSPSAGSPSAGASGEGTQGGGGPVAGSAGVAGKGGGGASGGVGGSSGGGAGTSGGGPAGSGGSAGKGGSGPGGSGGSGGTSGNAGKSGAGAGGTSGGGTSGGGTSGGGTSGNAGTSGGGTSGGGTGGNAGTSGAGGSPPCNTLVQVAPSILTNDVNGAPPPLTQGAIKPGTYYLTQETYYTGAPPHATLNLAATLKVTVVGQVATLDFVLSDGSRYNSSLTMATPPSGVATNEKILCTSNPVLTGPPGDITGSVGYTAGTDTLTLYIPLFRLLTVYTLQP